MITRRQVICSAAVAALPTALRADTGWALWERFAPRMVNRDGRVVDYSAGDKTTSEGQAYGLFFALVAGDRERFERILEWTQVNLSGGDLGERLPAWLYSSSGGGVAAIADSNPASDADLWLAYTLMQAGKLWQLPRYSSLGLRLAARIASEEVADLPGLGAMLLPGPRGFTPAPGSARLNASYLPLPLFYGLSETHPEGPWLRVAENVPRVVRGSSPAGFALDWILYRDGAGFLAESAKGTAAMSSYDAIRVYLWAGITDAATPGCKETLDSLRGMLNHLRSAAFPAAEILPNGSVLNAQSPIGFSAAMIPYLSAMHAEDLLMRQRTRLNQRIASGSEWRYYDMCLTLFALGWSDGRYRFDAGGNLQLNGGPGA